MKYVVNGAAVVAGVVAMVPAVGQVIGGCATTVYRKQSFYLLCINACFCPFLPVFR